MSSTFRAFSVEDAKRIARTVQESEGRRQNQRQRRRAARPPVMMVPLVIGKYDTAVGAGSFTAPPSETFSVYTFDGTDFVDSGDNVTVRNPWSDFTTGSANVEGMCIQFYDMWIPFTGNCG